MNKTNFSTCVLIICCLLSQIGLAQNAITDWAGIVAPAIMKVGSSTRPPASSEVLHATINLAVYKATMAIAGGYQQYGALISAPRGADVRHQVDVDRALPAEWHAKVFHDNAASFFAWPRAEDKDLQPVKPTRRSSPNAEPARIADEPEPFTL
jgi:hypothetical protein